MYVLYRLIPYITVYQKFDVNAGMISDMHESDPQYNKWAKLEMTAEDNEFYDSLDHKSNKAMQEELVWALKRNERTKREAMQKRSERYQANETAGCCVLL